MHTTELVAATSTRSRLNVQNGARFMETQGEAARNRMTASLS